jgi:hypothetical protein
VLLDAGVSVTKIKASLSVLKDQYATELLALKSKRVVISDGDVYMDDRKTAPVKLSAGGQMVFGFVLDIVELDQRARQLVETREARARNSMEDEAA